MQAPFISQYFKFPTMRRLLIITCLACLSSFAHGQNNEVTDCLLKAVVKAEDQLPIGHIRSYCSQVESDSMPLSERLRIEQLTEDSQFVITPHRQNYVLLASYNDRPNQEPWLSQNVFPNTAKPVKNTEVKLQISFKVPLTQEDIFFADDGLYYGFTLKSFWQVYNKKLSAPFRETNYQPELFYQAPIERQLWGGTVFVRGGIEHESNGRSQLLSRSWNRLFVGIGFLRDRWALYLQPWYRLPESKKEDDGDPLTPPPADGDDNPDIEDFYGHYEFLAVYKNHHYEYSGKVRSNFDTGKAGIELGLSFPLSGRLRGYLQLFNGYGESLIDYNHSVQRVSLGLLLTDFL